MANDYLIHTALNMAPTDLIAALFEYVGLHVEFHDYSEEGVVFARTPDGSPVYWHIWCKPISEERYTRFGNAFGIACTHSLRMPDAGDVVAQVVAYYLNNVETDSLVTNEDVPILLLKEGTLYYTQWGEAFLSAIDRPSDWADLEAILNDAG